MIRSKGVTRVLFLVVVLGCWANVPAAGQRDFGDAKLHAFAEAAAAIVKLGERWVPRIQNANSEREAAELRRVAQGEMIAAIERTEGITVEEYRQIAQAAQNDSGLRIKLEGMMQDQPGN